MSLDVIRESGKLYKEGKKGEARQILVQQINENPTDIDAWYALSFCIDDLAHKRKCLEQVLKIDSTHQRASAALERIKNQENVLQEVEILDKAGEESSAIKPKASRKVERKKAGQSTVQMGDRRRKKGLTVGIIGLLFVSILAFIISKPEKFGLGGGAVLVSIVIFFLGIQFIDKYTDRKSKESKRAYRGARAEEQIGALLASLRNGYEVLHDVAYAYGNIDHVVISDNGAVFMIETKSHGGKVSFEGEKVLVNGKDPEKDFIAQSLRNTYWLRDEIGSISGETPWVTAILVFTKAFVPYNKPIKGVHVVNKKFLLKTIKSTLRKAKPNPQIWDQIQVIDEKLSK